MKIFKSSGLILIPEGLPREYLTMNQTLLPIFVLKDIHREVSPSNKIPALTKSINMNILVVGTSKQPFIKSS